jgi:predicted PurR-regulated permease PerM
MLRNLLGNLGSGLIRLLVTVGIIAAIGYFLVRPALETTKNISKEANESIQKRFNGGFGKNGAGIEDVQKTIDRVNRQVEREIKRSFHVVESESVVSPRKLVKCIQRAEGNVHKIQRCTIRF